MHKKETYRRFVAKYYLKRGKGLIDLDKAFVLADDLWDRAARGNKKAIVLLGKITKVYNKRELA